jgi:chemotaxis protein MotB
MSRKGDRRKKRSSQASGGGGAPEWMVTYGDLMSLLLTFFVLLVSFSSIQLAEFEKAMGSLKGALGVLPRKQSTLNLHSIPQPDQRFMRTRDMENDILALKKYIAESGLDEVVEIEREDEGILVRVRNPILFELGKAKLKPSSFALMTKLGNFAKRYANELRVVGHTDDLPIRTREFPSNWELSALRAINVLHFLAERVGIEESRMSCQAFAEFRPLVPNTTPENRMRNRRVELLIVTKNPNEPVRALNRPQSRKSEKGIDILRFLGFAKTEKER